MQNALDRCALCCFRKNTLEKFSLIIVNFRLIETMYNGSNLYFSSLAFVASLCCVKIVF